MKDRRIPHTTSQTIAERIEKLYGHPLAVLAGHVDASRRESMLAALLDGHTDLQLAEHNIDFQRQRLRQLADPEREIGSFDAGHILDCARRIAHSVAVRDTHTKVLDAVLNSLHRVPTPNTQPPPTATPAIPGPIPTSAAARTC
jgi:hypothetical protein